MRLSPHSQASPRLATMGRMAIFPPKPQMPAQPAPCLLYTSLDKTYGAPTITNDGVSIAKEIDLDDPYERIGAELVKEVAKKTDDVAGDGTTTCLLYTSLTARAGTLGR